MKKKAAGENPSIKPHDPRDESTRVRRPDHACIIERWVDEHADYLFGFVLPRVRDRHIAEELVQETFLAAVKSLKSFREDSSPRTWLMGLLRRKIADHYRKRSHELQPESIDAGDATIDAWFDKRGAWIKWPHQRELDPAELQENADFWAAFESCFAALPERMAEVFSLKVMDSAKPDEVCKVLSISTTNLWVTLHRARARLRACLEANWFGTDSAEED